VLKKAAGSGYATATDLADWLVRVLGMPFREAHHVTGRIVGLASAKNIDLEKLTLQEMQGVEPRITDEIFTVLGVSNSVKSRTSYGGTAPINVKKQARRILAELAREQRTLASRKSL
jgi:argininosuccinate lyase